MGNDREQDSKPGELKEFQWATTPEGVNFAYGRPYRPKQSKEDSLTWVLDFLQADLDGLPAGELLKMGVVLMELLSDYLDPAVESLKKEALNPLDFNGPTYFDLGGKRRFRLFTLPEHLFPAGPVDSLDSPSVSHFLQFSQECMRKILGPALLEIERFNSLKANGRYTVPMPLFQSFHVQKTKINLSGEYSLNRDKTALTVSMKVQFQSASLEEALSFGIAHLMEDVQLSVFHRCPECNRWFAHFSERKKLFCSNRCAARYGVREIRKELKSSKPKEYEAELRAGAERAHKSYASKVKTGKPARRPYKHK
ncbi:MAG: hypothetical protein ABSH41_10915 [Syntrophobacteraceae bacterium]